MGRSRRARTILAASLASATAACELFVDASRLDVGSGGVVSPDASGPEAEASSGGDAGLVAYYSFDETFGTTAHDGSGNRNDGTLTTGATFAPGKIGRAVSLDGVSGAVTIPESPSLDAIASSLTIAMWVSVDDVTVDQMRLLSKENAYDLKLNMAGPQLTGSLGHLEFAAHAPPNEWHHVALVFDRGGGHLYLDGVGSAPSSDTFPASGASLQPGTTLRIGAYEGSAAYHTKGLIDEVRIYARALTAPEISALAAP
jgi:hypothetical protein